MFQRFNGLEETGECDLTMRLMLLAGQCVSRYMADQAEAEKELKKDDDCEAVQLLKRQLAELGFYSGETTGTTFTDALEAAVKLFQTANGLTATGSPTAKRSRSVISLTVRRNRSATASLTARRNPLASAVRMASASTATSPSVRRAT